MIRTFIIVDDDSFNNAMCGMLLRNALGHVMASAFLIPEEALEFIKRTYHANSPETILLLDINMPTLTAWQFMDTFKLFQQTIRSKIGVYILSSSVDANDKKIAGNYVDIKGFITKPLERKKLCALALSRYQMDDAD
jgi:CheY-like chemotaxis protein